MNGSLFAMLLYITLYLQTAQRFSPLQAGLRQAIITFSMMITAIPAGRASNGCRRVG